MEWKKYQSIYSGYIGTLFFILSAILNEWDNLNLIQKIIKFLFLWVVVIELVFIVIFLILGTIAKFINFIPLLRWIYLYVCYLIFLVPALFGIIAHIYKPIAFANELSDAFYQSIQESMHM